MIETFNHIFIGVVVTIHTFNIPYTFVIRSTSFSLEVNLVRINLESGNLYEGPLIDIADLAGYGDKVIAFIMAVLFIQLGYVYCPILFVWNLPVL